MYSIPRKKKAEMLQVVIASIGLLKRNEKIYNNSNQTLIRKVYN